VAPTFGLRGLLSTCGVNEPRDTRGCYTRVGKEEASRMRAAKRDEQEQGTPEATTEQGAGCREESIEGG